MHRRPLMLAAFAAVATLTVAFLPGLAGSAATLTPIRSESPRPARATPPVPASRRPTTATTANRATARKPTSAPTPRGTSATTPMLGALAPSAGTATLKSAGFGEVVISATWASIEPSKGEFSASATSSLQAAINAATASGLHASLDIGVQYAPSWIFGVGGGTQFVDQYGDVFTGSAGSGNYVPNAVTDQLVRVQLGDYLEYLGTHLTGVSSVRLGGAAYNELRYPSGGSGSRSNAYWFYDTSSQASLAPSLRGWVPGTGTAAQATGFLNAYNAALDNYGVWLVAEAGSAFPASTELEVLMPGWGERPDEIAPAEANLLRSTPDELNQGLDWVDLLPALPHTSRIVAYTTWADSTFGSSSNPDPAAFIHSILPSGMAAGGESTGNGQTTAGGEALEFQDAQAWHWYVANWFFNGQNQTPAQVSQSFESV